MARAMLRSIATGLWGARALADTGRTAILAPAAHIIFLTSGCPL